MKKKGFTLIELIAVISILAILAIIAVPRVMTYVDRSKKVAIQTEAITIYNAAEAAYNDGKFKVTKTIYNAAEAEYNDGVAFKTEHFEKLNANAVADFLEKSGLLSNIDMDKNVNINKNVNMYRFENFPNMTLKNLETIINTKPEDLSISSDGKLTGSFDSKGDYKKSTKEK